MEWYKETGKRIEALRKSKKITQKELADKVGVRHREVVKDWECFNRRPTVEQLMRLSEVLDVTVDYLLGKSESMLPADSNITVLTDLFGFSLGAAKELTILSIPANGAWAQRKFEALNRLLEETDDFEALLNGLDFCLRFGKAVTPYEAELIKAGRLNNSPEGLVTEEEIFSKEDRRMRRESAIYAPQRLIGKIAERFIERSEQEEGSNVTSEK